MSVLQETTNGRMEIGSTPKGEVGEEVGDMYLYSLETQEFEPEVLLLQYEENGIRDELEGSDPLLITPLTVDVGDGHPPRVLPRWVVEGSWVFIT